MKIQLGWLRDHVDLPEPPAEVAARLTALGLTVDAVSGVMPGVLGADGGAVFELDIGSNRPDLLSHVGVARELAAALRRPLRLPAPALREVTHAAIADVASIAVDAPDLCPRYAARVVTGVTVRPSPPWVTERLEACGIRPINVVVDVTNYVLLELGHPLHAFDLDLLAGRRILVRRAAPGESMQTLDGTARALEPDMLLIADARCGVAVAGVMGGANSEIRATTRDVLLESALFDAASIRRTSRRLGLHTEASHRFERGADWDTVTLALDRAAELLGELAGGSVLAGRIDVASAPPPLRQVTLRRSRIRRVTGLDVSVEAVERTLRGLGFEVAASGEDTWDVRVPRRRVDVAREVDLVEEVLRHHGFDRVEATLPAFREGARPRAAWEMALVEMRASLVASGHHQAVSYSFEDPTALAPWTSSVVPDAGERLLRLSNPLASNMSVMRTSLVPGLLRAASLAARHGEKDVRLFEDGRIYLARTGTGGSPDGPAEERTVLAVLATGRRGPRHFLHRPDEVDLLTVKGAVLDALAAAAGQERAGALSVVAGEAPSCAPGSGEVRFEGQRVGWVGRVHPSLLAPLELEQALFAAEIDLSSVLPGEGRRRRLKALTRQPKMVRDVSVLVDRNQSYGAIIAAIEGFTATSELVESTDLVDRYVGEGVPADRVSLTFTVAYRHGERTLTQDEVDREHARLVSLLEAEFRASLRA